MKYVKLGFFIILLFIFLGSLLFRISSYAKEYTTKFDPGYWKMRYLESQWVVPGSKNSIGDDGLYAYAGWEYIHGSNPAFLNAEIPPLAKYMIGLGEVVFQNQNILILLVGLACLGILFLINLMVFKDKLWAFIPVFLFSLDPLFYTQLRAPYLDAIYLFFLLLTILFTLRKQYLLASFFLGCFASTKYPAGSLFLVAPLMVWMAVFDSKNKKKFFLSLLLWPTVFLFSYVLYFIKGGSLAGFLGVQKWIVHFYATGVKSTPGIVFPLILFGKWYTWFGGMQKVAEWNALWAIAFLGTIFSAIPLLGRLYKKVVVKKQKKEWEEGFVLFLLWAISYLFFLIFTPVFPRYLLLLLPFMYNLTIWFLRKFILFQPSFS
ncbi:MAG: hypothetical protein ACM3IJ_00100 [Candidatus Levyibacteriota bacterium]